jgi:hypothetical protein
MKNSKMLAQSQRACKAGEAVVLAVKTSEMGPVKPLFTNKARMSLLPKCVRKSNQK